MQNKGTIAVLRDNIRDCMRLRLWLTVIVSLVPGFIAINVPRVFAQEICDANWVKNIEEQLSLAPYHDILAKVPHWSEKVVTKLEEAKRTCDPTFTSSESAVHVRDAMNLLEEGVDREYYSQESMDRLKGLILSKAPEGITRPLKSLTIREGIWGAGTGLIILLAFCLALAKWAGVHPLDFIITSDDNRFSLSRLQFWLWFVVVLISWGAISWATRRLYTVPENLYILMGVNVAATVASSAIAISKGVLPRADKPNFFKDIFMDTKQTLDLPRIQMFIWTLIIVIGYIAVVIEHYRQGLPSFPNIPEGLIVLMGISHGAYLGTKAAEKNVDAVSVAPKSTNANAVLALRQKADAGQKQIIDKLLNGLGYTTWDDFMSGKPAPASQEQIDQLLVQLKAQGIQ